MTRRPVRWLSLVAVLAVLAAASPARAQVAVLQNWQISTPLTDTPNNNADTVSFAVPAAPPGTNRVLLLAVVMELSNNNTITTLAVSFGGTTMSPVALSSVGNGGDNSQEQVALFYLPDSQIPAGAQAIHVTYDVNGTTTDVDSLHVYWSVFSGVDQGTPFAGTAANAANAASVQFGTAVGYVTGGIVTYAAGNSGASNNNAMTVPNGDFAQRSRTQTSHTSYTALTAAEAANGTYAATSTVTFTNAGAWSAVAVASLRPTPRADLSITKTDGVATYVPGGTTTYTIVASNDGPSAVAGASLVDPLPAQVTGATWSCTGAGGATCPAGSGTGNLNTSVTLPVGGSLTYAVVATLSPTATGNLVNTATIVALPSTPDPVPGNNSATDTDTPAPRADLAVTKTDAAAAYVPGTVTTYTIVASNAGPSAVTGAALVDTFDPARITAVSWTCASAGGATCPAASGTGHINASVNLPVGGSLTYTAVATIAAGATGNLVNTATITAPGGTADPVAANNSATDTDAQGTPSADVFVTKAGPPSAFRGDPATYTIVFGNAGPSSANGVGISDTFPAALVGPTWTCVASGGAACPAASGSGNIGPTSVNLPRGSRLTYTATATINSTFTGNINNTAGVTFGPTDPVPGNNSATWTTVVVAQTQNADVAVIKTGTSGPVAVGGNITWTIAATNGGPATAQNVVLSDPLPAGTTWISATPTVGTCSGTTTVTCSFGRLTSGATATVTIVARVDAFGTKSNTATVSNPNGSDYDPDPTNNSSTWLTTVSGSPTCGTSGGPGPGGSLSGVVNTYYPGTVSVAAGAANTCIPVGTARGAGAAISSGDVLLVVQMQDATISSSNDANYGGGVGTGGGALVVNAGKYEYVTARDAVGGGGCAASQVPVTGAGANGGLLNSYTNSGATTSKGQARYQIVRVPQYSTATLNSVAALPWQTDSCDPATCTTNGLGTGGILALDVAGTLTINGGVAAQVDGVGFRGAGGRQLTGGAGANTDYRTLSTVTTNGGKGEGNAGTPEWVYDATGTSRAACTDPLPANPYVVRTFQPNDGYPNGSMARGAPGNAGGGSTDDNPAANDRNSGGGGGSNGGAGGRGGLSWSTALDRGGLGAAVVPAISQLVLGGGGGAGTRNNSECGSPLDTVTPAQDAQASSGGTGGGLIAIRAGTLSVPGAATLSANGSAAYNETLRDGGGGGGAGGSIVLTVTNVATSMANLTLRANGGRGGDAWRTDVETSPTLGDRHGPGGGGGGGVVAYTVTAGAPTVSVAGGQPGITTSLSDTFGALPGGVGQVLTASPAQIPGVGSGAECPTPDPDPTIALTHRETTVSAGGPVTIFAAVTNVSPFTSVLGSPTYGPVRASITLDGGLTSITVASAPGWTCSVTGQTVNCDRTDALAPRAGFPPIQISAAVATSVVGPTTLTNKATVSGGGDVNPENNDASDSIGVRAPTLAHLRIFEALRRGRVVVLRWRTSYEMNNLGFRVYRETAGERTLVTPRILAGSAFAVGKDRSLPSGRSYAWIDRAPAGDARYWLEDIDLDGSKTWTGPAAPDDGPGEGGWGPGTVGVVASPALADLGREPARRHRWEGPRGIGLERRERPRRDGGGRGKAWTASSEPAAKLLVAREGWYRVTKQQLLAAGFDPGTSPASLRLLADGVEQAILVNDGGDGAFDAADSVEFYGVGFDSPWDGAHVYWLLSDRPGARIRITGGGDAPFPPAPSSFPFTVELRERTVQIFSLPGTGDEENFFGAVVTSEPVLQSLVLTNVDQQWPGDATLELALQGGFNAPHRVEVKLNGTVAGTVEFDGQARAVQSLAVPIGWLREGANDVTLTALDGDEDVSLVDYVRITYPHLFALDDGAVRMTAPGLSRVTLDGLPNRSLRVVDLSRPTRPRELAVSFASSSAGVRARFAVPPGAEATLYAFTPSRVLAPQAIVPNAPSRWSRRDNAADFLIVGHPSLMSSLEPLRRLRARQGLVTSLVDVTDVYDEFAYGQKTPYAIRDFLQKAVLTWRQPPRYVLLAGDASFDARNYLGEGDFDLVPAKLVRTAYLKTDSDDWYVDWNGDGIPELAIGRLPARTAAEAATMVAKIAAADAGGGPGGSTPEWARRVLFVSGPAGDYDFPAASSRLRALLPRGTRSSEIRIGDLGPAAAREAIVAGFNAGQMLVNFAGHASTEVWMERADGGVVFGGADAAALGSGAALVVSMTCLNGLFDDLWTESLAEALLKAPSGGAAAVWASSGLTEPSAQAPMNEELFRRLFAGAPVRLGDAIVKAKAATSDLDVRRSWILFGDPTMRLR